MSAGRVELGSSRGGRCSSDDSVVGVSGISVRVGVWSATLLLGTGARGEAGTVVPTGGGRSPPSGRRLDTSGAETPSELGVQPAAPRTPMATATSRM